MTPDGQPESWRELWQVSTPVMRWRLVLLAAVTAVTAVLVLVVL